MRFLTIVAAALLLGACNVVESLKAMEAQAEAAATLLEKDVGSRPFVGWNIRNGTFTNVNVVFDGTKVGAFAVRDLEAKVRTAVRASFKEQPEQLIVSAHWEQ